jgi:pimeloyl-ACP methyl ester carboxylesterase
MSVDEHTIEVAGEPVFYREAPSAGVTPLYLHSAPTSSDDWLAFLEQTGGVAPDLPGFGRSGKGGHLEYALPAYADFLEAFLDALDIGDLALVGHGWGAAIGLVFAQRHPERIEQMTIIDAVPLFEGFRSPLLVRRWRRVGLGELVMGSVNRWLLARTLRAGAATPGAWPYERIDKVWEQFDQGTQRTLLRLHRSIDGPGLAAAGADLDQLYAPALVVWGEQDPWVPVSFAHAYADRLPRAELEIVPGAGHWPWLDQPSVIDRICTFVAGAG